MIQKEFYRTREDGVDLYRTYSDRDMKIQKDGTEQMYDEAIDVADSGYTYTETDIPIEREEEDEQAQKAAAYDIIVGGEQNEPD